MIITDELLISIIKDYQEKVKTSSYTKFLYNKRVIIVGPDDRLIGKGRGNIIESYDVIVRFNTTIEFMPFKSALIKDIGKRTDVIYQCPSSLKILVTDPALLERRIIENNIRFINYQNGNKDNNYIQSSIYCFAKERDHLKELLHRINETPIQPNPISINKIALRQTRDYLHESKEVIKVKPRPIRMAHHDRFVTLKENPRTHINKPNIRLHYSHETCKILSEILSEMNEVENVVARTGFLAIWDAILHGAKSIHIEGMSFYNGGGHMFRTVTAPLDPLKNHELKKSPHNSVLELKLFQQLMRMFPAITIGDL